MNESRKIGKGELLWFLTLLHLTRILFTTIGGYVSAWANAGYILPLLSGILYVGIFLLTMRLSGGDADILSTAETTFGRTGKIVVGVIAFAILIIRCSAMTRVYADVISSIALPDGDVVYIILILAISAFFGAYFGSGVIVSFSYVAGIVFTSALALVLALNLPNYDVMNLFPLLGNIKADATPVLKGTDMFADVFLVYLVSPYLKDDVSVKRVGVMSIVIASLITSVTALCYIMTVEYPLSADLTLPVLEIAFDVNLDIIFQRAEGLFFFMWIFSAFISLGTYLAFASNVFTHTFSLSDRRGVISIICFIPFTVAILMKGVAEGGEIYETIFSALSFMSVILPIVVFLAKRKMRWYKK